MESDTLLMLTYGELKSILEEMQDDGFHSDGCTGDLYLNADDQIRDGIRFGRIKVFSS